MIYEKAFISFLGRKVSAQEVYNHDRMYDSLLVMSLSY